jgi:HPt (histidine-containing phosphotransfer) domain-containing protein
MNKNSNEIPDFSEFPVFNLKNMEKLRFQTRNKPELLKEIVDSFIEESYEITEEIKDYIDSSNIEMLSRAVHTLKGLSGTIGASRFYQLLSFIDACHKENDFSFKDELYTLFDNNLKQLKNYFEEEGF